jgi:hypothetical protein
MDAYLRATDDPSSFFESLMQILTLCDGSQLGLIPAEAQLVATEFIAIYTAELARYLMTGLVNHSWHKDLAEVTLLSAYGAKAGMVMKGGMFVPGTATDYFGVGTNGTGIGITRTDRKKLQGLVTAAERAINPTVVANVEKIIGRHYDVIGGLLTYLSNPANSANIKARSAELTDAMTTFELHLHADADEITKRIQM